MYLVGLHMYYKMIHGPYNIKFVYLVGLHIYYKMIHGLYSIKLQNVLLRSATAINRILVSARWREITNEYQ